MSDTSFSGNRFYKLIIYFLVYSFVGWCIEVIYVSLSEGRLVNRGFLTGPFCCVYGFGALSVIMLLRRCKHNIFLLFSCAAISTTLVEYVSAYIMEKAFNQILWNYSNEPFNIAGRVCLRNALIWGTIAVIMIYAIHPIIRYTAREISKTIKPIIIYLIIIYFISDFLLSSLMASDTDSYTKLIFRLLNEISNNVRYIKNIFFKSLLCLRNGIPV
ncbi:MAG: putative ABC transporter permease [Clostridia bacterium]|nr:putative ABC transporter permease [Clostridia bacterium]